MTNQAQLRPRKLSAIERLAEEIKSYREAAKLDSWTSFVDDLQVPGDLYPGVLTNRPQLIKAAPPRELSKDECAVLYKLIAGLLETNAALREHTERVGQLTDNLNGAMTSFVRVAQQIKTFANFEVVGEPETDEEE
jgi:hypothetical protein